MDFLRAAAKCLFYDYSLEFVADCICRNKKVKGKRCKHLLDRMSEYLLWREQKYSRESIQSVTNFIFKKWMGDGTLEQDTLNRLVERCFHLLRFFVDEVLAINYQVNFRNLFHWKDLSLYLSEDLLLSIAHAVNLIKNDVKWKTDTESYCWSNPVRHNHDELNTLLDKGLDDVHFHINGSVDGAELAWIFLMNHPEKLDQLLGDFNEDDAFFDGAVELWNEEKSTSPREWVSIAIFIRAILYDCLYKGKIDKKELERLKLSVEVRSTQTIDLQKYVGTHRNDNLSERIGDSVGWDYAEAGGLQRELKQTPWAFHRGERRFMTWMLVAALNERSVFKDALPFFYLYILIKIRFRRDYVKTNPLIGLQNFNHYYHALDKYKDDDWFKIKEKFNYALTTSVRKGTKDTVEMRVSPDLFDMIKDTKWFDGREDVSFVLTLFKSCYSDKKVATTKYARLQMEQIDLLRQILVQIREKSRLPVVGIDVVGSDLTCRPYVIAPFLRYAAGKGVSNITYHVAEDFCDVIDGLRALYELITFAEYKAGYRIGHASVLGVNVEKYYRERKNNVVCSRQMLLDNYIWLSRIIRVLNISITPDLQRELETKAKEQFEEIYPKFAFSVDDYWDSIHLRGDITDAVVEELQIRNVFKALRCNASRCANARKNKKAIVYWHEYLKTNDKGEEIVLVRHTKPVVKMIEEIRKATVKLFSVKKYRIESNPTSNLMIGPFEKYKDLPTFRFRDNKVDVSVNTDAKGVFATSLYIEYSLLALALQKGGKDWRTIEKIISELITNSHNQRFGKIKLKSIVG